MEKVPGKASEVLVAPASVEVDNGLCPGPTGPGRRPIVLWFIWVGGWVGGKVLGE